MRNQLISLVVDSIFSYRAEPLAWGAADDPINRTRHQPSCCEYVRCGQLGNINLKMGRFWKILGMRRDASRIDLGSRNDFEAGASCTETESADAGEQV